MLGFFGEECRNSSRKDDGVGSYGLLALEMESDLLGLSSGVKPMSYGLEILDWGKVVAMEASDPPLPLISGVIS